MNCFASQANCTAFDLFNTSSNTFMNCFAWGLGSTGTRWNIANSVNDTFIGCASYDAMTDINIDASSTPVFLGGSSNTVVFPNPSQRIVMIGNHGLQSSGPGTDYGANNLMLTPAPSSLSGKQAFAVQPTGYTRVQSLGIDNYVSNTNTPSGPTGNAMAIFDNNGNLLGYIPIYSKQW